MAVERENDRTTESGYKVYDARVRQGDTERTEVRAVLKRTEDGYATEDNRFLAVKDSPTQWRARDAHTGEELGQADRLGGVKVLIARAALQLAPAPTEIQSDEDGVARPVVPQVTESDASEDVEDDDEA